MAGTYEGGYQDIFEVRGRRYDDAMRRWPSVRDEEFGFVLDLARPMAGEVLVDIPSGGGYLADHVPAGVEVVAVDVADSFVERSRGRGIEAIRGDLTGDALAPGCADLVVSVAGMHHTEDHGELLGAWHRLLKPGGRLVAADVVEGSPEARFLDGVVGPWTSTGHAGSFFTGETAALATAAGYRDVRTVDDRYHWWADEEDQLAGFCAELFGLEDVALPDVLAALEDGPGITRGGDGRVGLRWGLRAVLGTSAG